MVKRYFFTLSMLFSLLLVACSNENTEENQDTFSNAKVGINEGVINEDSIFIITCFQVLVI